MRVDSHFHIWNLETQRFPWLQDGEPAVRPYGSSASLRTSYTIEHYAQDAASCGIDAAVYVNCGMADPLEEARYVQSLVDEGVSPLPAAIVAYADLTSSDAPAHLEKLAQIPAVRGVRYTVAWDANPDLTYINRPDMLEDTNFLSSLKIMSDLEMRLDCMAYAAQMPALARLAEKNPSVPVILNHVGLPLLQTAKGLADWQNGMKELAALPHVSVKISGIGMFDSQWTTGIADRLINETIDIFGAERCMFGSNYPVERLASSFTDTFHAFERAVQHRPRSEQDQLFGESAVRIYGINSGH